MCHQILNIFHQKSWKKSFTYSRLEREYLEKLNHMSNRNENWESPLNQLLQFLTKSPTYFLDGNTLLAKRYLEIGVILFDK
uniref:Uncharacterized protein n=1 Tax=Romanomermis culicivorax TaxID=13658 RepID=A0A915I4B1_ROMCU